MYYEIFDRLCKQNKVRPGTVSRATGISSVTFTNWKNGKYTPKTEKLQKIADYFGVTLAYMMGEAEPFDGISEKSWNEYLEKARFEDENGRNLPEQPIYEDTDDDKDMALQLLMNTARKSSVDDILLMERLLRKINR